MAAVLRHELARAIDHTLLRPEATEKDIARLCEEAGRYGFCAVVVAPCWVRTAVGLLESIAPQVGVASVVGFPHGNTLPQVKRYEAARVLDCGATEIDMVANIGALKSREDGWVLEDIRSVVETAAERPGTLVKVILETALLTAEEKVRGARLAEQAGARFVKTSTGFVLEPKTNLVDDVRLLRNAAPTLGVKAAGGIATYALANELLEAGATRLGCSKSVSILLECDPSAKERHDG